MMNRASMKARQMPFRYDYLVDAIRDGNHEFLAELFKASNKGNREMAYPTEALHFDMILDGKMVPYNQSAAQDDKDTTEVNAFQDQPETSLKKELSVGKGHITLADFNLLHQLFGRNFSLELI